MDLILQNSYQEGNWLPKITTGLWRKIGCTLLKSEIGGKEILSLLVGLFKVLVFQKLKMKNKKLSYQTYKKTRLILNQMNSKPLRL